MAKLSIITTGEDHLTSLDDNWVSCKGDRHDFPKLRVGTLPRGITSKRTKGGVYQLTYTCPDCGTTRTKTTLRGGIVVTADYKYRHPKGYLAPKGAGLRKADYAAELGRRTAGYVRRSSQAALAESETA